MDAFAVIPSPKGAGFVELSVDGQDSVKLSRKPSGRVFRKQILKYGDLLYPDAPGGVVHVDDKFADTLIKNFDDKICDIVQIPLADEKNKHTEDPKRNMGEVIGIVKDANGVYVDMDFRKDADEVGKTYLGSSALMHLDYTDTTTGERVGPTLLHTLVTNRPYVTGLDEFKELVAASADGADDDTDMVVLTSATDTKEESMTYDEWVAAGKADHDTDVADLQRRAAEADGAVKLSNAIQNKLAEHGLIALSAGQEVSTDELVTAVNDAGEKIVSLSGTIDTMRTEAATTAATAEVDGLIRAGKVYPKDKDAYVELKLSNAALFDKMVPEKPIVKLSAEDGVVPTDDSHESEVTAEVDRYVKLANDKQMVTTK